MLFSARWQCNEGYRHEISYETFSSKDECPGWRTSEHAHARARAMPAAPTIIKSRDTKTIKLYWYYFHSS
ncbi:unnamed protein product [Ixodes persulcatus]